MASGFFAVFDDIAALLDDVVVMSKIATKKTAGILGDDLAVNAEKASGFAASREIPILWAITKGSFLNKLIILPAVFLLSFFAPWSITPILLIGGIYLAYEGMEKIYEYIVPHEAESGNRPPPSASKEEVLVHENKKIKSAITTDFILSIEIIIIALGTVLGQPLVVQMVVVTFIAILATIGVYGIVALIVRMDDLGFKLITMANGSKGLLAGTGKLLVNTLPKVIKSLTVIGTIALLLVAGGIYVHNIHQLAELLEAIPDIPAQLLTGVVVGTVALLVIKSFIKISKSFKVSPQ